MRRYKISFSFPFLSSPSLLLSAISSFLSLLSSSWLLLFILSGVGDLLVAIISVVVIVVGGGGVGARFVFVFVVVFIAVVVGEGERRRHRCCQMLLSGMAVPTPVRKGSLYPCPGRQSLPLSRKAVSTPVREGSLYPCPGKRSLPLSGKAVSTPVREGKSLPRPLVVSARGVLSSLLFMSWLGDLVFSPFVVCRCHRSPLPPFSSSTWFIWRQEHLGSDNPCVDSRAARSSNSVSIVRQQHCQFSPMPFSLRAARGAWGWGVG